MALVRDKLYVNDTLIDPETYVYTEDAWTDRTPRGPPRYKRAGVGSTPDRDMRE